MILHICDFSPLVTIGVTSGERNASRGITKAFSLGGRGVWKPTWRLICRLTLPQTNPQCLETRYICSRQTHSSRFTDWKFIVDQPCSSTFDASFADWGSKWRQRKSIGGCHICSRQTHSSRFTDWKFIVDQPCSSTFDASFADWGSKWRLRKSIGGCHTPPPLPSLATAFALMIFQNWDDEASQPDWVNS